jgi:hypothetical protein
VIQPLRGLTSGEVASLHKCLGNLYFVENTVPDDKSRFKCNTFFGSNSLVRVMRISPKTANVGVMPTRRDPKDDRLFVLVKDWLNDLLWSERIESAFRDNLQ